MYVGMQMQVLKCTLKLAWYFAEAVILRWSCWQSRKMLQALDSTSSHIKYVCLVWQLGNSAEANKNQAAACRKTLVRPRKNSQKHLTVWRWVVRMRGVFTFECTFVCLYVYGFMWWHSFWRKNYCSEILFCEVSNYLCCDNVAQLVLR